jgi:hypothetical protein
MGKVSREQVKVTRWQLWRIRSLWKHRNALFRQNSRTDNSICVGALSWWNSKNPVGCNFHSNPHHIFDSLWHHVVQILYELPRDNKKTVTIVLICDMLIRAFFCPGDWPVPFRTLPHGFRIIFEKSTFVTCYEPIKRMFSFEPFKHFYWHSVSTRLLIVIQISLNNLCTQFSHVQILCNILLDGTFVNIQFIGDRSNTQTSILTSESPHTVEVCACSRRGGASRSPFIFHCFSPIYKVCMPPKYLSTL